MFYTRHYSDSRHYIVRGFINITKIPNNTHFQILIHIKSICAYISCRRATNFLLYKIYCFVQVLLLLRIVAIYSKYIIQNRKTFEKFPYPPRKNLLPLAIFSLIQLWPNPMHYDITLYKISKYETARDRKSCLFSLWGYIIVIFQ